MGFCLPQFDNTVEPV